MAGEPRSRMQERIEEGFTGPRTVEAMMVILGPLLASCFLSNRVRNAVLGEQNGGEPLKSLEDLTTEAVEMFLALQVKTVNHYMETRN